MTPSNLLDDLRARGVVVGLRGGKLKFASDAPLSPEDAALLKSNKTVLMTHLEHRYAETLAWAKDLLSTHSHVWLESLAHVDGSDEILSQFKDAGLLTARRIWLDTWGLWFILYGTDNAVLELRGEEAHRQFARREMEEAA